MIPYKKGFVKQKTNIFKNFFAYIIIKIIIYDKNKIKTDAGLRPSCAI